MTIFLMPAYIIGCRITYKQIINFIQIPKLSSIHQNIGMSVNKHYALAYQFEPQKVQSNLSATFKNSGRNQKHSFAARYNAPINDLDYTKPILQFSPKKKNDKSNPHSKEIKQSIKNPQNVNQIKIASPIKKSTHLLSNYKSPQTYGIKYHQYLIKTSVQKAPKTSLHSSAQIQLKKSLSFNNKSSFYGQTKNTLRNSDFGLSQCELIKTISGKIEKKNSYNIQFQKMTNRPQNVNKIWYDKNKSYSPIDRENNKTNLAKTHSFKSTSGHQAFIVREVFEKNYNSNINLTRRRSDINIRHFEKVKPRPNLQIKVSTNLSYEKSRSLQNKKRPLFQLFQIQRKFNIPKQVISPNKGAYR